MSAMPTSRELGRERGAPPWRRRVCTAALLACFTVLVMLGFGAYRLLEARRDLLAGAEALQSVRSSLQSPSTWRDVPARHRLRQRLGEAEARFTSARTDLAPLSFLLPHLSWVPRLGTQLSVAPDVADAADSAAFSGLRLIDGLQPVWQAAAKHGPSEAVMARIAPALASRQRAFRAAETDAAMASGALRHIPRGSGSEMLGSGGRRVARGPPLVRAAHSLAHDRSANSYRARRLPSTYPGALQDLAELRATGLGFHLGGAGLVTLVWRQSQGDVSGRRWPTRSARCLRPTRGPVHPRGSAGLLPGRRTGPPDFPLSARLSAGSTVRTRGRVDGVIAIDDPDHPRYFCALLDRCTSGISPAGSAANVETHGTALCGTATVYHGPITGGSADTAPKTVFGCMLKARRRD